MGTGLQLVVLLCSGWKTKKDLCSALGVTPKTISRMLKVIGEYMPLHMEYMGIKGQGGVAVFYKLDKDWAKQFVPHEVREFWKGLNNGEKAKSANTMAENNKKIMGPVLSHGGKSSSRSNGDMGKIRQEDNMPEDW